MNNTKADERRTLKEYLTRYYKRRQLQGMLAERLTKIRAGEQAPESGEVSIMERRIREQAEAAERSAMEIMDIIGLLRDDTTERLIMELRHIDCKPWREIHATVHLTRSPCYEYYKRGLNALLEIPKVRATIDLPTR